MHTKMVITMTSFSLVKPAKQAPNANTSISDCDQDKPMTHVPLIYFYKPSNPLFSFQLASQILKDSLSEVLVYFYPFVGRLHLMNESSGRIGIECTSDNGAMFYEAESDGRIEDFKDFAPTKEIRSLIPSVDYANVVLDQQPLLLVQLTRFCGGGISLGLAISHIICDATCTSHFISEWARTARGESLLNQPFLDRSILVGSSTYHHNPRLGKSKSIRFNPLPLLMGKVNDNEERSRETTVVMLNLSAANVMNLKAMANEGRDRSKSRYYSLYEVVAGHMWKCACKARKHSPDQPTRLAVSVSFRKLMSSSIPKWYFGNSYYKTYASSTSGELTNMPLSYAASKIREAIEMVTEDYVKLNLDLAAVQPDLNKYRTFHVVGTNKGSFVGNPNMSITSWVGIPFHGQDFGWGKEIFFGPGVLNFDGKSFIMSGQNEVGSLTIALRLQTSHIHSFIEFFYKDIEAPISESGQSTSAHIIARI